MALPDLTPGFFNILLHLDTYLGMIIAEYGMWTYPIIFAILFVETINIFSAFLPGGTLVFTAGAIAGLNLLNIWLLYLIVIVAVFLGDSFNYMIGRFAGYVILKENFRLINKKHIEKTNVFFQKYGAFSIITGKYIPFARTLIPLLAGVGKMSYWKFALYELISVSTWGALFLFGGYFFGGIPFVQRNFVWILVSIVVLSSTPILAGLIRHYHKKLTRKSSK